MRTPAFRKRLYRAHSGNLPPERSAHELGRRNDPDSAEIQPVRIPARADRWVFVMMPIRMPRACVTEKFKSIVRNIEKPPVQAGREFRPARSMPVIGTIILAAAVVEHRKKAHHIHIRARTRGQKQAIFLHPPPVGRAMYGVFAPMKLFRHKLPEFFEIDVHAVDDPPSVSPLISRRSSSIPAKSRLTPLHVCIS